MTTAAPAIDVDALLRRLHLPTVRRLYPELAQRAEQESPCSPRPGRSSTTSRGRPGPGNSARCSRPTRTRTVLVIDEVGYLSYGPDAANVLSRSSTTAT
jgi:hypothetical protein